MWAMSNRSTSAGVSRAWLDGGSRSQTKSTASSSRYTARGAMPSSRCDSRPIANAAITNVITAATSVAMIVEVSTVASGLRRSDTDALGQHLAMVGRVAEEQLGGLGALEVEVRRVLPG